MSRMNGLGEVINLIQQTTKAGAAKKANPISEPGEHDGQSSHPTAKADDGVQKAKEGPRSSENESDVKATVTGSLSPNSTAPVTDSQESQQPQIGTKQAPTGEDPSVEQDYKDGKDDPGTSHPASTSGAEKYGSWSIDQCVKHATARGNDLLADIGTGRLKAAAAPAPAPSKPASAAAPSEEQVKAAQSGYELAALLGAQGVSDVDLGREFVVNTIKEAHSAAEATVAYIDEFNAQLKKKGGDDGADEGEDHDDEGDASSGASDSGSAGGKGSGGDSGGGSGSGPSSAESGGGGGGMDVAGALGSIAPAPAASAQGSPDEVLQQLAMAMMEQGVTPEALASLAASAGGGMGGGAGGPMPPVDPMAGGGAMGGLDPAAAMAGGGMGGGAGGMPPADPMAGMDPMAKAAAVKKASARKEAAATFDFKKVASKITELHRKGFSYGPPKNEKEAALRKEVSNFLREIV